MLCLPRVLGDTTQIQLEDGKVLFYRKSTPITDTNSRFCEKTYGLSHFYEVSYCSAGSIANSFYSFPFNAFHAPPADLRRMTIEAFRKLGIIT